MSRPFRDFDKIVDNDLAAKDALPSPVGIHLILKIILLRVELHPINRPIPALHNRHEFNSFRIDAHSAQVEIFGQSG